MMRVVRRRRRSLSVVALAGVIALVAAVGAIAYWTTSGSGSASASSGSLSAATISAPGTSTGNVTITWDTQAAMIPASQSSNVTYIVERKQGAGAYAAIGGPGPCSGSLPFGTSSCTDAVGTSGTYTYRVVAHFSTSWTAESNELDVEVTVDLTPPTVSSINRVGANPTNATSVQWTVTFSENVTGVDITDFALTSTGTLAGGSVTGVSGSNATYTVTADTGTGEGTIRLDVVDDDSIADGVGKALGGTGVGNGDFTTGQIFVIDRTGPTVTLEQKSGQADPTNTLPIRWTVTFSEPVTGFDASDLTRGGGATGGTVGLAGTGAAYEISLSGTPTNGTISFTIGANQAQDAAGNNNSASTSVDNTVTYDTVPPAVTLNQKSGQSDPTNTLPILWTVTFSEPVTGFDASDLTRGGTTTGGTVAVTGSGDGYEISLSGTPTNGTTLFTIAASKAQDLAGNVNTASTSTDNTVTYDTVAPLVAVAQVNGANRTFPYSTNVDVTSIGGTCGVLSGDLAPVSWSIGPRSGSATCSSGTWSSGAFTAISAEGSYTADATQADAAGNTGNATDRTVIVDKTAPLVAVAQVNGANRTFPYSTNVDVTSIGGTCGVLSGDLAPVSWSIGPRSGSATCSSGTWSSGAFTAISAEGSYTADATQADAAGNTGNATDRTVIVDKTAPLVAVAQVNGANRTFPYSTNVDVTSIGGTCGVLSGDLAPVSWSIGPRSGSATCSSGTWSSGAFTAISAEGSYTADATQADAAGNTGNATDRTVIVDKTAPLVAVAQVNGANRTFPYSTNVDVTSIGGTCGVLSGDLAPVSWSIGPRSGSATCSSGTWSSGAFTAISAEGSYTADATQADAAGNTGNATDRTVIVDKTAPLVAVAQVNGANRTFPYSTNVDVTSIGGTCGVLSGDLAPVSWSIGPRSGSATCSSGTWSSGAFTAISAEGSYTADATQADAAGNTGNATDRTVIVDKSAPVITATCPTNGGSYNNDNNGGGSWNNQCSSSFSVNVADLSQLTVTVSLRQGAAGPCWNGNNSTPAFNATCPNAVGLTNTTGNIWSRALGHANMANNTYTAFVTATDSLGMSSTLTITFTIT